MQTDDALIQRVAEGDDDAFREIVERFKDPLVNYLTHLLRSRDRAEEVAQDAFVRLYRNASKYRMQQTLGPYLYRIATNLVVTAIRRERRWSVLLPRLRASSTPSVPWPDRGVLDSEIQSKVTAALDGLPVRYRGPLVLFEIEEWSYAEIAVALGLRVGTVKSRISRARDLMRRRLAPWWNGGNEDERQTDRRVASGAAASEGVAGIHR